MKIHRFCCLVLAAFIAWPVPAVAAEAADPDDKRGVFTLQLENDVLANTDGQFSHGTRLAWMSPKDQVPDWAGRLAGWAAGPDAVDSKRMVYSLGQSIFTPDDITIRELVPDDRPYAGWLYAGVGLESVGDGFRDNMEINLGVVGPAAFAEDVQTTWHEWFGFRRPQGWDNQLRNEPGIQINLERKWRAWPTKQDGQPTDQVVPPTDQEHVLDTDMTYHVGVGLGNIITQAAVGMTLRIGQDLRDDYAPPRIRPSLPGSDHFISRGWFGWYLFAGVEARAVAHNIFLDGNSFRDSHSVDKKNVVADFQAGVAIFIDRVRLSYTHVLRTKEFDTQDAPAQFGAFSASIKF